MSKRKVKNRCVLRAKKYQQRIQILLFVKGVYNGAISAARI